MTKTVIPTQNGQSKMDKEKLLLNLIDTMKPEEHKFFALYLAGVLAGEVSESTMSVLIEVAKGRQP